MEAYNPARQPTVGTHIQSCAPTVITQEQVRQTPACTPTQPHVPIMSTPITPPGAPQNFRSEFSLSPVIQATPTGAMRTEWKPEWKPYAQTDTYAVGTPTSNRHMTAELE